MDLASLGLDGAVVAIATIPAFEAAVRLDLTRVVATMLGAMRRSVHVLAASGISEHWKERVLPVYSVKLLAASSRLVGAILVLLLIYAGALTGAGLLLLADFDLSVAIGRLDYVAWAIIVAALYWQMRCRWHRYV